MHTQIEGPWPLATTTSCTTRAASPTSCTSPLTSSKNGKPQRRVRFSEQQSVYYEASPEISPNQDGTDILPLHSEIWYNHDDFDRFKAEVNHDATAMLYDDSQNWKLLMQAYFALRSSNTADDTLLIWRACENIHMDATTVGLHQLIGVQHMTVDYQIRRRHLMDQVQRLQGSPLLSKDDKELVIAETSRLTSFATRNYAFLVAKLSMEAEP